MGEMVVVVVTLFVLYIDDTPHWMVCLFVCVYIMYVIDVHVWVICIPNGMILVQLDTGIRGIQLGWEDVRLPPVV